MKYEYVTVPLLTHATKQILDTWGSDGWELVQVIPSPGGGDQLVAYMKREIKCCLLYTSPSPRDRQKSRMPSSA